MTFGLVFPEQTCMVIPSELRQINDTHWCLDLQRYLGKILAVYLIPYGGAPSISCGILHRGRFSNIFVLPWAADQPDAAVFPFRLMPASPDAVVSPCCFTTASPDAAAFPRRFATASPDAAAFPRRFASVSQA